MHTCAFFRFTSCVNVVAEASLAVVPAIETNCIGPGVQHHRGVHKVQTLNAIYLVQHVEVYLFILNIQYLTVHLAWNQKGNVPHKSMSQRQDISKNP